MHAATRYVVIARRAALALVLCLGQAAHASPRSAAAARLAAAERERRNQALASQASRRDLASARTEGARLADQRAQQAASLRETEADIVAATARLGEARHAQQGAEAALARRETAFASLLPAMLRLSRAPAETLLAVPVPPSQATEGLQIARGLATVLSGEADALHARQTNSEKLREETLRETALLETERASRARREAALDEAVTKARARIDRAEAAGRVEAEAIEAAAAQATSVREAIAAMDAAQAKAEAQAAHDASQAESRHRPAEVNAARDRQAALARPKGSRPSAGLVAPVAGTVLHAFTAGADGPATGMTYAAVAGSFVVSPCGGRVAFAAPFRSYGKMLILECAGGLDLVLAGLGRLDAAPGHSVRPGEPVGRMPAGPALPPLYVELRVRGQPVDPAPYLVAPA